jgi:mannosyl-3-phosphoglycerate phosphatase
VLKAAGVLGPRVFTGEAGLSTDTLTGVAPPGRPRPIPPIVVFAALDTASSGADGESHLHQVRSALASLDRKGIPVLVWSGRTRAEVERMRARLGARGPFVTEHGGALFVPADYFPFPVPFTRSLAGYDAIEFGLPYDHVVALLHRVASTVQVEIAALSDMTIEEAARALEAPLLEARLAKLREYGELFRLVDRQPASGARLFRALRAAGLTCWHAGTFDHVSGLSSRLRALETAQKLLQHGRERVLTIGIGSQVEDLPVLKAADRCLIVRHRDPSVTARLSAQAPLADIVHTPGPAGWTEAIARVDAGVGA